MLAPLGAGGSSVAWRALDRLLERPVALKQIDNPSWRGRLLPEFSAVQGLVHPNLVSALEYEVDHEHGEALDFIVYELVEGQTLDAFARGAEWSALRRVVCDVLAGLLFLHSLGLSHGDVKASNVLVREIGEGVLIDFGCARRFGPAGPNVSGTPGYLPREVLEGGVVDGRNDLFALGVTIDRLLPGLASRPNEREIGLLARLHAEDVARRPSTAAEVLELLGDPRAAQPSASARCTRMLGRAAETALVERGLEEWFLRGGGATCRLFWGPPGIGKTRLLQELKWSAQTKVRVVEGSRFVSEPVREMVTRGSGSPVESLGQLVSSLDAMAGRERCVFLLDDVDLLDFEQRQWFETLLRCVATSGAASVLATARSPLEVVGSVLVAHELTPLGPKEVATWCERAGQESSSSLVYQRSAGYPGEVEALLSQRAPSPDPDALAALTPAELGALAALVAHGGRMPLEHAVEPGVLSRLFVAGWVRLRGDGFSLLHEGQRRRLEGLLPSGELERAHARLAEELVDSESDAASPKSVERAARRALHLLGAGDLRGAERALLDRSGDDRAWVLPSERLATVSRDGRVLLACARVFQAAHDLESALRAGLRALRLGATESLRDAARVEIARILLRRGRPERALSASSRVGPGHRAEADLECARASVQLGDYERALELASSEAELPEDLRQLRSEVRGTALVYLSQLEQGRIVLESLARELAAGGRFAEEARVESLLAIAAFRSGDLERARLGYQKALSLAEEHGVVDLLASTSLNWATLCQQLGDWGAALSGYERAQRLAVALGRRSTEHRAAFNLGNLFVQIGAFERAEEHLTRAEAGARESGNKAVSAAVAQVRGELLGHLGHFDEARASFDVGMTLLSDNAAGREMLELTAQRLLLEARIDPRSSVVRSLETELERASSTAPDVDAWVALAVSRVRLRRGDGEGALGTARRAESAARRADVPMLDAACDALLAEIHELRGERVVARRHRNDALASYGRLAASLPGVYADVFWAHPDRRELGRAASSAEITRDEQPLLRFLSINRHINSRLGVDEVLEAALDAAIELTRAERGFVLLKPPRGEVSVRARRRIHPHDPEGSSVDFSRSIAERVLATESPVITVDAQADARFVGEASVAALALKSVACVPFRSQREFRGALYVDNRLASGRFSSVDTELLLAFGDQVAIALDNTAMHEELLQQKQELEAAKRQLERLVQRQERDIEKLELRLDHQQAVLEHRFDYGQIKGRGPAMQKVFALLDRVIDTDVTVLITGESGTGKELVARAIHYQSPRKRAPLVAINCGALPEQLLESELFGHVKGAFSGAIGDKQGLLVAAGEGTVFLDEIGEMPMPLQVKLLRAIQEREVLPLGATKPVPFAGRITSATHRDLGAEVERGRFREDLFFRLAVITVELPPLRERLDDLPELALALLQGIADRLSRPVPVLTRGAMDALAAHRWPGNVRELENVLTKAVLLGDGVITPDLLRTSRTKQITRPKTRGEYQRVESDGIVEALSRTRWNVSRVAKELGIPRNSLYRRIARLGLERPPEAGGSRSG